MKELHLGLIKITQKNYAPLGEEGEEYTLNIFPESEAFIETSVKDEAWVKSKNPALDALAHIAKHIEEEGTLTITTQYYVEE
jgi:hypothetical protein